MASLDGFDARTVEASKPMVFEPLPDGTYTATITDSVKRKNSKGTGDLLELSFKVQVGEHSGKTLKAYLNLWNPNEQAKEIAWREMSAICHAVGVMQPNDSTDLHGLPLDIIVKVRQSKRVNPTTGQEETKYFNDIKGYQKRVAAPAQPQATTEPAAKPAWA